MKYIINEKDFTRIIKVICNNHDWPIPGYHFDIVTGQDKTTLHIFFKIAGKKYRLFLSKQRIHDIFRAEYLKSIIPKNFKLHIETNNDLLEIHLVCNPPTRKDKLNHYVNNVIRLFK